MNGEDIETELAGLIYRTAINIQDPKMAREIAKAVLAEFKVSR